MLKRTKALLAMVAALALGLVTLVGVSSPASAAQAEPIPTLTVHKYTTPAGAEGDGSASYKPGDDNKPVAGVQYKVYRVNDVDLNTNAGWLAAAAMQKQYAADPSDRAFPNGTTLVDTKSTMADGTARFQFAAGTKGLYLVKESSISGATVDGKPANVVPSKPFLVAVPMTNRADRTSWNYDVNVYPKNAPVTATKTVDDSSVYAVGEDVTFTVSSDVPASTGTALNKYMVIDQFDTAHYTYKSVAEVKVDGDALTSDNDYVTMVQNGLVKVDFGPNGLAKLEQHRGGKVTTKFVATVKALGDSDGKLTNTAYVVPSDDYSENVGGTPGVAGSDGKLPPIASNAVVERFAKIKVTKLDTDGNKLGGAKFELHKCSSAADIGEKLTVDGKTSFTTDAMGQVTIDGVRLSDFYNNQKQDSKQLYCLKETEAPAGYELLPEAVVLDVSEANVTNGVYSVEVKDVKYNAGFHLPLTGSNAAVLLGVLGALLVVGGVFVAARKRRQR